MEGTAKEVDEVLDGVAEEAEGSTKVLEEGLEPMVKVFKGALDMTK